MTSTRNTLVLARVTPEEKRALRAAAMRRGLTVSQLIRDACNYATGRPIHAGNSHQATAQ